LRHRLERTKVDEGIVETDKAIRDFDNDIERAFQLATFQGPLCAEPVEGMAYFVEQVEIDEKGLESEIGKSQCQSYIIGLSLKVIIQNKTRYHEQPDLWYHPLGKHAEMHC
jgi:translation elongation factor EF-G